MLMDGNVSDFKIANEWLEKQKVTILNDLKASGATDITFANKSSSFVTVKYADGKEVNFTWHHHQDCETMMLVKQDIHSPNKGGVRWFIFPALLSPLIGEKFVNKKLGSCFA